MRGRSEADTQAATDGIALRPRASPLCRELCPNRCCRGRDPLACRGGRSSDRPERPERLRAGLARNRSGPVEGTCRSLEPDHASACRRADCVGSPPLRPLRPLRPAAVTHKLPVAGQAKRSRLARIADSVPTGRPLPAKAADQAAGSIAASSNGAIRSGQSPLLRMGRSVWTPRPDEIPEIPPPLRHCLFRSVPSSPNVDRSVPNGDRRGCVLSVPGVARRRPDRMAVGTGCSDPRLRGRPSRTGPNGAGRIRFSGPHLRPASWGSVPNRSRPLPGQRLGAVPTARSGRASGGGRVR